MTSLYFSTIVKLRNLRWLCPPIVLDWVGLKFRPKKSWNLESRSHHLFIPRAGAVCTLWLILSLEHRSIVLQTWKHNLYDSMSPNYNGLVQILAKGISIATRLIALAVFTELFLTQQASEKDDINSLIETSTSFNFRAWRLVWYGLNGLWFVRFKFCRLSGNLWLWSRVPKRQVSSITDRCERMYVVVVYRQLLHSPAGSYLLTM